MILLALILLSWSTDGAFAAQTSRDIFLEAASVRFPELSFFERGADYFYGVNEFDEATANLSHRMNQELESFLGKERGRLKSHNESYLDLNLEFWQARPTELKTILLAAQKYVDGMLYELQTSLKAAFTDPEALEDLVEIDFGHISKILAENKQIRELLSLAHGGKELVRDFFIKGYRRPLAIRYLDAIMSKKRKLT